jgi:hypothetical protein
MTTCLRHAISRSHPPGGGGGAHAQRQGSATVRGFVAAGLSRGGACAAGDGHRKVTDIMITR